MKGNETEKGIKKQKRNGYENPNVKMTVPRGGMYTVALCTVSRAGH
jgi:hypothetical protein